MTQPEFNVEWSDFLAALVVEQVEFVIVGAHALAFHGRPRATGDLDVLVRPAHWAAVRACEKAMTTALPFTEEEVGVVKGHLGSASRILPSLGLPRGPSSESLSSGRRGST